LPSSAKIRANPRFHVMWGFLLRRILSTIPVLLIVAVLVFLLLRLTPGDPAAIIAGDAANPEQIAAIRTGLSAAKQAYRKK
jgi:peptide/nickel transport system permease protein